MKSIILIWLGFWGALCPAHTIEEVTESELAIPAEEAFLLWGKQEPQTDLSDYQTRLSVSTISASISAVRAMCISAKFRWGLIARDGRVTDAEIQQMKKLTAAIVDSANSAMSGILKLKEEISSHKYLDYLEQIQNGVYALDSALLTLQALPEEDRDVEAQYSVKHAETPKGQNKGRVKNTENH